MKDNDPLYFVHWRKHMAPAIKQKFPSRAEVASQIEEAVPDASGIGKVRLAEIMASVPRKGA